MRRPANMALAGLLASSLLAGCWDDSDTPAAAAPAATAAETLLGAAQLAPESTPAALDAADLPPDAAVALDSDDLPPA